MSDESDNLVPLEFVGTDDLITELARRHPQMLFAAVPLNEPCSLVLRVVGNKATAAGLAVIAKRAVLRTIDLDLKPMQP